MIFLCTALVCYAICAPGIYVILRLRLASNIVEGLASGSFLGLGFLVLFYEMLSWHQVPVGLIDVLAWIGAALACALICRELRRQRLPLWMTPVDRVQMLVVGLALLYMLLVALGDLSYAIDDDAFVHLPNVKRIAMGDLPPHFPYFPDAYLRGHIGRDLFTGTIARFLDLRPELAIIYVTLAICPLYILMFHALAWRLAAGTRVATCFCFFGLLFLVSFTIGPYYIRTGSITYVFNNNAVAFGYAAFFGWLLHRELSFAAGSHVRALSNLTRVLPLLAIASIAYVALYFIYISNFLFVSLFMGIIPMLFAASARTQRAQRLAAAAIGLAIIIASAALLQSMVSPFFWERVAISLGIGQTHEPMGFTQQARLAFPKANLFSITAPSGDDIPFFTWNSLSAQGLSFYMGVATLFIGLSAGNLALATPALFGSLTMLWLLLVDMGEYRAETLRVLLIAHMGFGASAGLGIGLAIERLLNWLPNHAVPVAWGKQRKALSMPARRYGQIIVLTIAAALCAWMARGNFQKLVMPPWPLNVADSIKRMTALAVKNPENWNYFLNMSQIDFELFQLLQDRVKSPSERALLKLRPDERFKGVGHPINIFALQINAAAMTGAGIVGVAQEHGPPHMSVAIYPYDYRASLFWQNPTADLLAQISPDWILLDPALVPAVVLDQVMAIPGVTLVRALHDADRRERVLLHYVAQMRERHESSRVVRLAIEPAVVKTPPFALIRVPAAIQAETPGAIQLLMEVVDDRGGAVNVMDLPIVPVTPIGGDKYELAFSMIQPGHWHVYFLDAVSRARLNQAPLQVEVGE
jgi:hypothetical protein